MNEHGLDDSESDQDEDGVSMLTFKNTIKNARQYSHSIRTLESGTAPNISSVPNIASTELRFDLTDAHDRDPAHITKIKFSEGTKESDQLLSRIKWQRRATAAKKRDESCEKQDPDGSDSPETGELRSEWWEDWQEKKKRAKQKRAEERRAMSGASGSTESSHGSEKLSGSDLMQLRERNEKSNGAEEARRTSAANDETPLRRRLLEPSRGHSGGGSEILGPARTVLPMESIDGLSGISTRYPDDAGEKLRRGRTFL